MDLTLMKSRSPDRLAIDRMISIEKPSVNDVYHHGIKGQKWGVRNGPPYPLDSKTHASVLRSGSGHIKNQHRSNLAKIESMTGISSAKRKRLIAMENQVYKKALADQAKIDKGKDIAKKVLLGVGTVGAVSLLAYGAYKSGLLDTDGLADRRLLNTHGADISSQAWLANSLKEHFPGVQCYTHGASAELVCYNKFFSKDFWENTLSYEQRLGVQQYTGSAYDAMNRILRGIPLAHDWEEDNKSTYEALNSWCTAALEKTSTAEDIIVHRGISGALDKMLGCSPQDLLNPDFQAGLVGRTFTEKGFYSSAASIDHAWGGVKLHAFIPKGSKGMYVDPISMNQGEKELLLQRNSSFVIKDYKLNKNGKITDILIELVDQTITDQVGVIA